MRIAISMMEETKVVISEQKNQSGINIREEGQGTVAKSVIWLVICFVNGSRRISNSRNLV